MGRHKCEAVACVSSQLQCIFFSIELLHCSFYYGEKNVIIYNNIIIIYNIDRHVNGRIESGDDAARLYKNLVNFGPVSLEITRAESEIFVAGGSKGWSPSFESEVCPHALVSQMKFLVNNWSSGIKIY